MKKKEVSKLAQELGRRGGKKRAENLTKEQLSAIGRAGALTRWKKKVL